MKLTRRYRARFCSARRLQFFVNKQQAGKQIIQQIDAFLDSDGAVLPKTLHK